MTSPETPAVPSPSAPPLALLLDVDGPVASPVTRDVQPGIIADLLALAAAGIPVVFNTGRSDAFIREQVMEPMIAAGMPAGIIIHAICEKGAVWFSYTSAGPGPVHVDNELAIPRTFGDDVRRLVAEDYSAHMFFDETKRAMVSVEQHIAVANSEYLAEQELFDADAMDLMARHGLGVVRLDHHAPDSDDQINFRVDPTIISTDIESVRLGKDLGASRAVELLAAAGHYAAGLAHGGRLPHGLRHGGLAAPQRPRGQARRRPARRRRPREALRDPYRRRSGPCCGRHPRRRRRGLPPPLAGPRNGLKTGLSAIFSQWRGALSAAIFRRALSCK